MKTLAKVLTVSVLAVSLSACLFPPHGGRGGNQMGGNQGGPQQSQQGPQGQGPQQGGQQGQYNQQ